MKKLFFTLTMALIVACAVAQTSYTWNGSASTAWNTSANWTPNGIPAAADNITIVTGSNPCNLSGASSVTNITVTSGTFNLGGFMITATGNAVFTAGTVNNGTLTVSSGTGNTATLGNTTFGATAVLNITTGAISVNGGTYGNNVSLNQTGAVQTSGTGGAVFNGSLVITNSGSNNLRINGSCTFNGAVTYNNTGAGYLLPELNTGNTYNSTVSLNNTGSSNIRMCYNGTTNFNGNISINNTGTANVIFGEQATAIGNLNTGTISIGGAGFTAGTLFLYRLKQLGSTAQNITVTGAAQLSVLQGCVFNGTITLTAPTFAFSQAVYNGAVTINKTGSSNDGTAGGNTYNSTLTVNHTGGGYFTFGNGMADIYNGDVYANNTGTERIIFGHNSTGNQFNGNVYASQSGTGVGISIGWTSSATNTVIMAPGKNIFVGAGGFTAGYLQLCYLQQSDATAINLTTTGTSSIISNQCTFTGTVNMTAPDIYPYGGTYNAAVTFTKTGGGSNNHNNGFQNIFNAPLTINQQSSTGYFLLGYNSNDLFNDNIILNATGSGGVSLGWNGGTGTPTLAAGKTITVGAAGFSAGYLQLGTFTQLGSTANNLTLTGGASFFIVNAAGPCVFGGALTVTAPDLYIRGGTFNAPATFTKTGTGSDHNNGWQNIFNSTCTINNQGSSGYLMLGYNSNDLFNDNISVSSVADGGISLGWYGGTGTPTLAAGKTISVGAAGFSAGYLQLGGFTQLGTTANTLTMTGTSSFYVVNPGSIPCVFGGPLTVTAADLYIRGGTFNGITTFTKTGGGYNHNNGAQNIFNAQLNINQQGGVGYFMLGYNSNDLFNDNIVLTSVAAGGINLGYTSGTGTPTLASGKTITIGAAGFSAGYLRFGGFNQLGTTPINLTLTGTSFMEINNTASNSVFGGSFTATAPDIYVRGGTFNGAASFTKTGGGSNHNNGVQNFFNSTCTINQQSSSGYFMLGYNANDQFNGDIIVTSTGTGGIFLGWSGGGTGFPVLAAGKTILVGPAGFNAGYLQFNQFTQLGAAPVNLTFTGTTAYLMFARNSVFGGNVTSVTPDLFFNGATFNGTVNSTKTGPGNDYSAGGNTFNAASTYINTSAGYLVLGNSSPDTWNADATFSNTGSERIFVCNNSIGNQFNGNIIVNSSGSAVGINFCNYSTATATIAATKTILVGTGYASGYLLLQRITQLGSAPVNLTFAPTATYIQYGPGSLFGGNVTSSSPGLFFTSCTFSGTTACTKTGASNDASPGNTIFNGTSTITNSGAGYLVLGNSLPDTWNADVTFTDNGTERLLPAYNTPGNMFNGTITVNSTGTATGIAFCAAAAGTATLAAGKTIQVGAAGFSSGYLILQRFTQLGNAPISLTLASPATYLQYGPAAILGGNTISSSPGLFFHGCTFNGTATCTKTGSSNDVSAGSNVFTGVAIMNNTGSGNLTFGNGNSDQFITTTTLNNTGSGNMHLGYNSSNNIFNGLVTLNNSPSSINSWIYVANSASNNCFFNDNIIVSCVNGGGIQFGSGTGTTVLASGKTISIGATGFNSGALILKNFTQTGSTAQSLTTTGSSYIQFGPVSSFDGNVTTVSPGIYFHGCTFNGTTNSIKNGTGNNASNGGNIFNGATTLTNTSINYLLMANTSADAYNADVTFVQSGTGLVYPNYNASCTYAGNVTVTSPASTAIVFGSNPGGVAVFTGTAAQSINRTGSTAIPVFTRLVMNKASNAVTLNTRINISAALTMTSGNINTAAANILNMNNASATTIGNASSYINGPMNYDVAASGARSLSFPIGKVSDWRPAVVTVNHTSNTAYTYNAEVFNAAASDLGYAMPATVDTVSSIHYWDINRYSTGTTTSVPATGLSGNQAITLYFGTNDDVRDGAQLTVCKNTSTASTTWFDIGGTGGPAYAAGAQLSGSITSTSTPTAFTSFSRFTLGSRLTGWDPLPIELLYFTAVANGTATQLSWSTATETNNDHFEIEKSSDGITFDYLTKVAAAGSGNSTTVQKYGCPDPHPFKGINYYRLKQVDKNGSYVYSAIASVEFNGEELISFYPNPTSGAVQFNIGDNAAQADISIIDAYGKQVAFYHGAAYLNGQLDLTGMADGIYSIVVTQGSTVKTTKIILQR